MGRLTWRKRRACRVSPGGGGRARRLRRAGRGEAPRRRRRRGRDGRRVRRRRRGHGRRSGGALVPCRRRALGGDGGV